MMSAALGTWVTPKASILTIVIGGFFIFPALSRENPFNSLAMQVAFVLPLSMLLLVPVGLYRLNWFFLALIVLVGAHYLSFASLFVSGIFFFLSCFFFSLG